MRYRALVFILVICVAALSGCGNKKDSVQTAASAAVNDDRPVDLDLSKLSGTVVYSQVYDMLVEPEEYMGKKIRVEGIFGYYKDTDTKQEYFAVVIPDATACCAQGIEFVRGGEYKYPVDYPPIDTDVTVTGIFGTYDEDGDTYIHLTDAQIEW